MKPHLRLAETKTPDGKPMMLFSQDGEFSINFDGQELMHSAASASETLLGELGLAHLRANQPARLLIGGLGLGITLRRVLEGAHQDTRVEVVELIPAVVAWNRTHLAEFLDQALADSRVKVSVGDVVKVIRRARPGAYDAILLDIDNGPVAMVAADNARLYTDAGLHAIKAALRPGGRVVVWSAGSDRRFEARLKKLGFLVDPVPAKTHRRAKRANYLLYVATRLS